jgi:tRNA pseudouridine55 synthase
MQQPDEKTGFLFIDKPTDMTSHDVVNIARKLADRSKIGHAGTLDPFATGLLILAVTRQATKQIKHLMGLDKTYEAEFVLGAASDTGDKTGEIKRVDGNLPNTEELDAAMQEMVGISEQRPPNYSAIKHKGKKLYELARAGKDIDVPTRTINVTTFERTGQPETKDELMHFPVRIHCASGTYVRAMARDLGQTLGIGGYTKELHRTDIGPFSIDESVTLEALSPNNVTDYLKSIKAVLETVDAYEPLAKNPRG